MRVLFIGLAVLLISACSPGSGKGLDASGRPVGDAPDPGDLPTLANIQARVFTPICTQCHVGANAPRGLRLDSANAFNDLVNVASQQVPALLRVEPFDADNSYLVQKIEGTASQGGLMPLGGPPLPPDDIMLIRQWITEGAMPDATNAQPGMTAVSSVRVSEQKALREGVGKIVLGFTRELDATTVHAGSVLLTTSRDDVFGDDDDRIATGYAASVAAGNPFLVIVDVPAASTDRAWYRLTLGSPAPAAVLDLSGQPVQPYELELH